MGGRAWLGLLWLVGLPGCTDLVNPDFPADPRFVQAEWDRMKREPAEMPRPIVVLDGWRQPDFSARSLARLIRRLTGVAENRIVSESFLTRSTLDRMADDVVRRVERTWPSDDAEWTTEVDVVGFSMGGIVARAAAMPGEAESARKRLKIRRLYTIGTPHRGANLAKRIAMDKAARDMRPGTAFLERLNAGLPEAGYELVCYTHTNDRIVGARNAAPPGLEPLWVQGTLFFSHFSTRLDRRILVDLALRLRNEPPLSIRGSEPPSD